MKKSLTIIAGLALGILVGAALGFLIPFTIAQIFPQHEPALSFLPMITMPAGAVIGVIIGLIIGIRKINTGMQQQ